MSIRLLEALRAFCLVLLVLGTGCGKARDRPSDVRRPDSPIAAIDVEEDPADEDPTEDRDLDRLKKSEGLALSGTDGLQARLEDWLRQFEPKTLAQGADCTAVQRVAPLAQSVLFAEAPAQVLGVGLLVQVQLAQKAQAAYSWQGQPAQRVEVPCESADSDCRARLKAACEAQCTKDEACQVQGMVTCEIMSQKTGLIGPLIWYFSGQPCLWRQACNRGSWQATGAGAALQPEPTSAAVQLRCRPEAVGTQHVHWLCQSALQASAAQPAHPALQPAAWCVAAQLEAQLNAVEHAR